MADVSSISAGQTTAQPSSVWSFDVVVFGFACTTSRRRRGVRGDIRVESVLTGGSEELDSFAQSFDSHSFIASGYLKIIAVARLVVGRGWNVPETWL